MFVCLFRWLLENVSFNYKIYSCFCFVVVLPHEFPKEALSHPYIHMHSTLNSVITQTQLPIVVFGIQSSEHGDKCESATETEAEEEKTHTHTNFIWDFYFLF